MTTPCQQASHHCLHRLPRAGKTLACLIAVMLTASVLPVRGQEVAQNAPPVTAAVERPPQLPEELKQEVAGYEELIDAVLGKPENLQHIKGAILLAERVLNVRLAHQGDTWWQTIDVRQQLGRLHQLLTMPPEQRAELAGAGRRSYHFVELFQAGKYEEAIEPLLALLDIERRLFGEGQSWYSSGLSTLGVLYRAMGRYEEAEPLLRQSLAIRRNVLGEEHPAYAAGLNILALLYDNQGRYEAAEPLYRQALAIRKNVLGDEHPDYATSLNNLGALYQSMGRYEQAEPLYRQALAIRRNVLGEEHPAYATSLNNLGVLYQEMSRYEQAEPLYRQALAIWKKVLGEEHPDYATSLNNLGWLYQEMGRYEQAELLYRQALAIRMKVLGEAHPDYAFSLYNLGALYQSMGRYEEAEPLYRRALEIRKKVLGEEHPAYAQGLNNLALLYGNQGRYEEAEPLYRQALAIRKKVLGEEHPDYAESLNNLAHLYGNQGRYEEAEPLYRQALAINRKVLGEAHPDYALSLGNLAALLAATGRYEEASGLLLASVRVTWRHLTRNFPTLSEQQKRQFLAYRNFLPTEALWGLVFQGHGVKAKAGLEGALLSKQLLFEAARQESGALLAAVAAAPPEWQAKWRERERLRRRYATLALQGMAEAGQPQQPGHKAVDLGYVRSLAERIEGLEQQLRQANPDYALGARLHEVSLGDVTGALLPGEALVEYVSYRPYDFATNEWGSGRYGAFVLPGDGGEVLAIDLGEAEAIDQAVRQFQAEVRESIEQFGSVEPSRGQVRRSERKIGLASSALRALVWQPLAEGLSGIGRVYVAPDGLLSLIPFEALAVESESGGWRYLAEERELIYLGTGRDLGRLALGAEATEGRPRTAVLIGNPAFGARPRELAAVVAGLRPTTLVARSDSEAGPSTLGGETPAQAQCQQIGSVGQVKVLADLIEQAQGQLEGLGWSVTTLTDQLAVEEAALAVQAPRILQFATHGLLLDPCDTDREGWDNPLLRSVLLMAGVNRWRADSRTFYRVGQQVLSEEKARARGISQQELEAGRVELADGILTAYELTGMNLRGTELVNLTACETGLGEVTPDGVVGLRQAFLLAGARSLTMSMWEVPAAETSRQIRELYEHWLGGGKGVPASDRYGAFRAAQLSALARARQDHGVGHPFYWAGVVFVGDPGDLPAVPQRKEQIGHASDA